MNSVLDDRQADILLPFLKAWMQRGEFDRNPVRCSGAFPFLMCTNSQNGLLITGQVLHCIGIGSCAFTQHVKAVKAADLSCSANG